VDREDSDGGNRGLAVLVSVYGAERLRCGRNGAVVGDGGGGGIKPGCVGTGRRAEEELAKASDWTRMMEGDDVV
jgi:hypothetical protein